MSMCIHFLQIDPIISATLVMIMTVLFSFRDGVVFATTRIAGVGVVVLAIGVGFGLAVIQVRLNLGPFRHMLLKTTNLSSTLVLSMAHRDTGRLLHCARSGHGRRICHDTRVQGGRPNAFRTRANVQEL